MAGFSGYHHTMGTTEFERARITAHLEGALDELQCRDVSALSASQRARRKVLVRSLCEYISAGRFPQNRVCRETSPVFIDEDRNQCAVAHLLSVTGHAALAEHIAQTRNLARVAEMVDITELVTWLDDNGLSVAEAARIQPAYPVYDTVEWRPTVAVLAMASVGERAGFDAVVGPELRVGVRRSVASSRASGVIYNWSLALMASYRRAVTVGVGGSDRFALLLQWEPELSTHDAQWYLLAGPRFDVDEDSSPGGGVGGEIAVGLSFRRRDVPLTFEVFGEGSSVGAVRSVHGGVRVGIVY